jgi:hypothetical protein
MEAQFGGVHAADGPVVLNRIEHGRRLILRHAAAGSPKSSADSAGALGAGKPQDLRPASNRETDEWWHLLDGAEAVLPVDLAGYYKRTG